LYAVACTCRRARHVDRFEFVILSVNAVVVGCSDWRNTGCTLPLNASTSARLAALVVWPVELELANAPVALVTAVIESIAGAVPFILFCWV